MLIIHALDFIGIIALLNTVPLCSNEQKINKIFTSQCIFQLNRKEKAKTNKENKSRVWKYLWKRSSRAKHSQILLNIFRLR